MGLMRRGRGNCLNGGNSWRARRVRLLKRSCFGGKLTPRRCIPKFGEEFIFPLLAAEQVSQHADWLASNQARSARAKVCVLIEQPMRSPRERVPEPCTLLRNRILVWRKLVTFNDSQLQVIEPWLKEILSKNNLKIT